MLTFLLGASLAIAQDVTVLEDSTPDLAPGQVYFRAKDGKPLEVGLVTATDVSSAGTTTIIEKLYKPLCTMPCAVEMPVGWHEFRIGYENRQWIRRAKVESGTQTFRFKTYKPGLTFGGYALTVLIVTAPVGIPMMVAGQPGKVKVSKGPPEEE